MTYTKLQILRSTGSGHIPQASQLDFGQLAILYHTQSVGGATDGRLFYKDSNGIVQVVSGTASPIAASASWSSQSISASYAILAQNVLGSITSASYALTASYAMNGSGSGGGGAGTTTGSFTGSFTGAFQGDGRQIYGIADTVLHTPLVPHVDDEEFITGTGSIVWSNQGNASASVRFGKLVMTKAGEGSVTNNLRILQKTITLPSGSWRMRTRVTHYHVGQQYYGGGIALVRSAATKGYNFGIIHVDTGVTNVWMTADWFNGYSSLQGANIVNLTNWPTGMERTIWLQARYDGSTYYFDWSPDGIFFTNAGSSAQTTIGGQADQYGLYTNAPGAAGTSSMGFDFMRITSSSNIND
jgi:hypothetical protein